MKSIVKIALGIVLGGVVLIAGCTALLAAGVDEAQDESDRTAITLAQYRSVDRTISRDELVDRFGDPADESQIDQDLDADTRRYIKDGEEDMDCVYYTRKGKLASLFQFCFDGNGRYQSKSAF